MFINKDVKYWKSPILVFTEFTGVGGDNSESEGDYVDGSNNDVCLDNVNAGDGENKVDLGDSNNGCDDSNDDFGVDNVGRVNTNVGDDAGFGNGDSKFDCGDEKSGGDGDDKDDGGVDDDSDTDSNIGNDANRGDSRRKFDCSKDKAADDDNCKSDGGCDTNDHGKGGDDSDGESYDGAEGHKNEGEDDGCLNSVKNCFKNKETVLERFSLPDPTRWRKSL